MDTNGFSQSLVTTLFFWMFAGIAVLVLLRNHRDNRNPLEWQLVDRCLLIIGMFCFVGGAAVSVIGIGVTSNLGQLSWTGPDIVRIYYQAGRIIGFPWICLLLLGLWLRRRAPENQVFAHATVQYSAIYISVVCYAFGSVTHPGPFLLAMALGTLNLLLFEKKIAIPWIITFSILTIGFTIGTWGGVLPYAPIYLSAPFGGGHIETVYFLGAMALVMIVFLLMLLLMADIFARWRDRETKVAEMSDLLKKMFGRYLSKEVMNSIIEDPLAFEMGGERRSVTIMMTDLRGFTALSERLEPEQVVQLLNSYFEVMVEEILKYKGTINEIIGDALLVIFGAPQEMPDRAQQGIACAIAMQKAMSQVNEENLSKGLPEIEMGIGINEAEVIVGNVGSVKRSKYAVVGSGVNMASRIESYTVGGQILISESVRRQAGDILRIDGQREVFPKGAETPLKIYEVGGIAGQFHLSLEEKASIPVTLSRQIPIGYKVLHGKDIGKRDREGTILSLSKKSAEIRLEETIQLLTNLKMNLAGVEEDLAGKNFYGKVTAHVENDKLTHNIRFTAIPPELKSYFQAIRRYGGTPTSR